MMLGLKRAAKEGDGKEPKEDPSPKIERQESQQSGRSKLTVKRLGSATSEKGKFGSRSHSRGGLGKFNSNKKEKDFNFGKEEYLKLQAERNQVVFDADFESGNLESVRRRKRGEYDVFIRSDSNSSKALNWFYFRMKNSKDFVGRIKISIVNMTKENSLF